MPKLITLENLARFKKNLDETMTSNEGSVNTAYVDEKVAEINAALSNKVDKDGNKGLSTNDFTNEEKEKLENLSNYDDTAVKSSITEEKTARETADTTLQNNIDTKYTKPSTGIPKTDLSSDVKASLDKADNALQSIPEEYVTETELNNKGYANNNDVSALTERVFNIETKNVEQDTAISSINTKYTKPSTGIPKTDLASDIQVSLSKADTALQSVPTEYVTETELNNKDYATNDSVSDLTERVSSVETKNREQDTAISNVRIGLQTKITEDDKLSSDLVDDTSNVNKFVTTTEKENWNSKASTDYVDTKVGSIVGDAPDGYDTLYQMAIKVRLNEESLASLKENNATQDYVDFELGGLENKLTPLIDAKVDKVTGKGLSTNDYTTTEKNKLSGIEAGAQKNVQSDWIETDTSSFSYIKNKPSIPTPNNGILTIQKNGTHVAYFSANQEEGVIANIKVPTSASEVGAEPSFTKNTAFNKNFETTESNIKMNGTQNVGLLDTVARADHIHPTDTSRASVDELSSLAAVVDNKVSKEDGKGLSTNDYTTTEKNKLAGIEAGAQVNPTNYVTTDGEEQTVGGYKTFTGPTTFKYSIQLDDRSTNYNGNSFLVGVNEGKLSVSYGGETGNDPAGTAFEVDVNTNITNFKTTPTVNGVELATKTDVEEAGGIVIDDEMSTTSGNPLQNKVITAQFTSNAQERNLIRTDITNLDNAKFNKTGGTLTGNLYFVKDPNNVGSHNQTTQPNLKWVTVNENSPYVGYATDQTDGTFVIGSNKGTNYASGLAIGGGSGNLLWKGSKVATINDIPSQITVDSALSSSSTNPVQNKVINTALGNKVDKVSGKGLSTNDYTTAEKTKLSGIAEGANKTTVDSEWSSTSTNPIQNKVIYSSLMGQQDTLYNHQASITSLTNNSAKKDLSNVTYPANTEGTTTSGSGDRVINTYISSDGLTWARIWASGWKECGSFVSGSGWIAVTMPITFSNTNYIVLTTLAQHVDIAVWAGISNQNKTTSSFLMVKKYGGGDAAESFCYYACGY